MFNYKNVVSGAIMASLCLVSLAGCSTVEAPVASDDVQVEDVIGVFENRFVSLIYPTELMKFEEIHTGDPASSIAATLVSGVGLDAPENSVPRIDIMEVYLGNWSNEVVAQMGDGEKVDLVEDLASGLVASYCGVETDDYGVMSETGDIGVTYTTSITQFDETTLKALSVADVVFPDGADMPNLTVSVDVSGVDSVGIVSIMVLHEDLDDVDAEVMSQVFRSVQYIGGGESE